MDELVESAQNARENAYVPYSNYPVGAAIRSTDQRIWTGCNIEISNFSNTLHAEEVALSRALVEGARRFTHLAVSSKNEDGITPCGMCRQTLAEFCRDDLIVICDEGDNNSTYTLGELLPESMGPDTLDP